MTAPSGSGPGYRRPVLIIQADEFNRSRIATVIAVVVTSNIELARAPGNVPLNRRTTGLRKKSVVNVSQVVTLDRTLLTQRVKQLSERDMVVVEAGLRLVLGLP